jgi:uncharacterized protein YidB (DUF937 family)
VISERPPPLGALLSKDTIPEGGMSFLDNLLGSLTSGQNASGQNPSGQNASGQNALGGIGGMLLGMLASEGGQPNAAASTDQSAKQAPAAVSGGLSELVQRLQQSGLGDVVQSWVGSGPNRDISPEEVHQAIGPQTVDRLSQQTGISHSALLPLLAQVLPLIVDRLTPNQRIPNQTEVARMQSSETIKV